MDTVAGIVAAGTAAGMAIAVMAACASDIGLVDVTSVTAEDVGTAIVMIVVMDGAASTKSSRRPAETQGAYHLQGKRSNTRHRRAMHIAQA